jgi:hypothetical protein
MRDCSRSDQLLATADNKPPAKGIAPLKALRAILATPAPFPPAGRGGVSFEDLSSVDDTEAPAFVAPILSVNLLLSAVGRLLNCLF